MSTPVGPTDTQPPTAPTNLTATGSLDVGAAELDRRDRRHGRGPLQRPPLDDAAASRRAPRTGSRSRPGRATPTRPPAGTYYYKVTAEDAAGNVSAASNEASATHGDVVAPSAPGTLTAIGAIGQGDAELGRRDRQRRPSSATTSTARRRAASRRRPRTGSRSPPARATPTRRAPGTYFYKVTAEDAAGNVGPASNEASATITTDTQAPTAPAGPDRRQCRKHRQLSAGRRRPTTSAWSGTTSTARRRAASRRRPRTGSRSPTGTSFTDAGLASGTYYYKVTAEDAAGNVGAARPARRARRSRSSRRPGSSPPTASTRAPATTTADQSGNGNTGTLAQHGVVGRRQVRRRALLQRHQRARQRHRQRVAAPHDRHDARGLGQAEQRSSDWRTVVLKERTGYYAEALYANTDTSRPVRRTCSPPATTSCAAPSDAPDRRLDAPRRDLQRQHAGAVRQRHPGRHAGRDRLDRRPTPAPLRIGGNAIWGEYFNGLIDEVRVYNRALTATEIQGDMDRSVTPDTTRADGDARRRRRTAPPGSTSALGDGDVQRADAGEHASRRARSRSRIPAAPRSRRP